MRMPGSSATWKRTSARPGAWPTRSWRSFGQCTGVPLQGRAGRHPAIAGRPGADGGFADTEPQRRADVVHLPPRHRRHPGVQHPRADRPVLTMWVHRRRDGAEPSYGVIAAMGGRATGPPLQLDDVDRPSTAVGDYHAAPQFARRRAQTGSRRAIPDGGIGQRRVPIAPTHFDPCPPGRICQSAFMAGPPRRPRNEPVAPSAASAAHAPACCLVRVSPLPSGWVLPVGAKRSTPSAASSGAP